MWDGPDCRPLFISLSFYLFIIPRIIWCRALWQPLPRKEAWSRCSAKWDDPDCRPQPTKPSTSTSTWLQTSTNHPPSEAHPSHSSAMKKLSPGDPCPGRQGGQARNYWSFAATDHIWWSYTLEIGRGVGWSVSACIRSWQQSPCLPVTQITPETTFSNAMPRTCFLLV